MPEPDANLNEETHLTTEEEIFRRRIREHRPVESDPNSALPPSMVRLYEIQIVPSDRELTLPLRHVRAIHVGKYVKLRAVVSRISGVRPCAEVMVYTCNTCKAEIYKPVDGDSFMPVLKCTSQLCVQNKVASKVTANFKRSRLIRQQEVKLQECPDEVPIGCVPRTLNCIVTGENTRKLVPGDSVTLGGFFAPIVKKGFDAIRSGLLTDTRLEVHYIRRDKRSAQDAFEASGITQEDLQNSCRSSPSFYADLARSLAPEIFGMDDVKKALLLLLIGGVTAEHMDGMRIRGDIHMLLMGDPGVAKSQLLKQVSSLAPRAVYSTGRGSSGAGLTAAVLRDKISGEVSLEGGALVLADRGVCCIDEFDKMEEQDRTAIHQVMEQQVVSISKAGISTTLNARASILAAANPAFGRYDVTKSAVVNMNLPASLLSRFDVQFLLLDESDRALDMKLAQHVLAVHKHGRVMPTESNVKSGQRTYTPTFIRAFVSLARRVTPVVPRELVEEVVSTYVEMRTEEMAATASTRKAYTTPRALLGILRMAQALARLHLRDIVEYEDICEARRLIKESKGSVEQNSSLGTQKNRSKAAIISDCWKHVLEFAKAERLRFIRLARQSGMAVDANSWSGEVNREALRAFLQSNNFSGADIDRTIDEYVDVNLASIDSQGRLFLDSIVNQPEK